MLYNNDCGCNDTTTTHTICNQCSPTESCDCEIKDLSTDCILYDGDDIQCDSVTVIAKNINLTDNLKNLVDYNCGRFSEIEGYFKVKNVGTGFEIYSGDNLLGEKQLRTLTSTDNTVTITENTETIDLSVQTADGSETKVNAGTNVTITGNGTTATPYVVNSINITTPSNLAYTANPSNGVITNSNGTGVTIPLVTTVNSGLMIPADKVKLNTYPSVYTAPDGSETKVNASTNISVTGSGTTGSPYVITNTMPIPDGSETKVTAGTATTVTGNGTTGTPYIINAIVDGSETKVNAGTNVTITGNGTTATPYIVNSTASGGDGSETKINSGVTTTVTGNGTTGTPYVVETVNLQKTLTYPTDFTAGVYTLTTADNNYSIKINNGSTAVTISVPVGLETNFFVGITQRGTGDITLSGASTTLNSAIGLKIKGQYYHVGVEQIGASNVYDILGNTKV